MRISAAIADGCRYTVYDHPAGGIRYDLCWVDDVLKQVGVGHATWGHEFVRRIEQRKSVLIITALRWVALDLPEEEAESKASDKALTPMEAKKIADELLLEYVVVR